jgi:hypothetical protein
MFDAGGSSPDGGGGGGAGPESGSESSSGTGVLRIAALTATVSTLTGGTPLPTESNGATFTAIVTDSLGLDSLAGGQLLDDTGLTYAAFGTGAGKGTYVAAITWASVNQTRSIDFTAMGSRTFVAKFFDNQGNTATASLQMNLACRDDAGLVDSCGGGCTQLSTFYANCGACGRVCKDNEVCVSGTCTNLASTGTPTCFAASSMRSSETCTEFCAGAGHPCTGLIYGADLATCTARSMMGGSASNCGSSFNNYPSLFLSCICY